MSTKFSIKRGAYSMPRIDMEYFQKNFPLIISKAWASFSHFKLNEAEYHNTSKAFDFFQYGLTANTISSQDLKGFCKRPSLSIHFTNVCKATMGCFLSRGKVWENYVSVKHFPLGLYSSPFLASIKLNKNSISSINLFVKEFSKKYNISLGFIDQPGILYNILARPKKVDFSSSLCQNITDIAEVEYLICFFFHSTTNNKCVERFGEEFNDFFSREDLLYLPISSPYELKDFYLNYPLLEVSVESAFFGASIDAGHHTSEQLNMHLYFVSKFISLHYKDAQDIPLFYMCSEYKTLYPL